MFFVNSGPAQQVDLARVDTIPLGQYSLPLTGAVQDSSVGWAIFNYSGGSFRLVQTFSTDGRSGSSMLVFWNRRDRPPAGQYPLSAEGGPAPTVRFAFRPPAGGAGGGGQDIRYAVQSGTLTIEVSQRYVLGGRYEMSAADSAGHTVTIKGVFSAGCSSSAC